MMKKRLLGPLAAAAVVVGVLVIGVTGATADTVSDLTASLLKSEPLVPDGTVAPADPLPFGHTIHVVTHDNQDGWKVQTSPTGAVTFENDTSCDTGNTPLPSGALHLVVAPGAGTTYARLRSTRYHRTYLRDLTRLDYYACDVKNNGTTTNCCQWPFLLLLIDWNGDNVIDDQLIFEPIYQNAGDGGACGAINNQAPPVLQKWQFWDALKIDPLLHSYDACYWATSSPLVGGTGTAGCGPGVDVCSLSEYITQHPDAAIVNLDGNHGGVEIIHGFSGPTDSYDGWVDAVTIGKDINTSNGQANSTITYDYQAK
jgi:hypothetical protein